jgi:hypothetical protein
MDSERSQPDGLTDSVDATTPNTYDTGSQTRMVDGPRSAQPW